MLSGRRPSSLYRLSSGFLQSVDDKRQPSDCSKDPYRSIINRRECAYSEGHYVEVNKEQSRTVYKS